MDTRITHILEYGIIIGQWWRSKDNSWMQQTKRICRITEKGRIVMDMPPKLLPEMDYTLEELLRDWELVTPARLKVYTNTDGISRTQIYGYIGYRLYDKERWNCIGEFKNA